MLTSHIVEKLKKDFNEHFSVRLKRPNIVQIVAPLFHEDGDMMDIFLDLPSDDSAPIRISDHGLTLMRLSYSYDIDTPTKRKVLDRILSENGIAEERGRLSLEASVDDLYPSLLQFAQTVAKVSNMQAFKREVVQNLFYEILGDFVKTSLASFHPSPRYQPIPDRDDLEVDWRFSVNPRNIFLYGVKDSSKARLAALTCREFQLQKVLFRSVIVHEEFEDLPRKDKARITNAADKQFTSLADFTANAEQYFAREVDSPSIH